MRAVIAGGGLAGLAAALRLRAAGWDVTVCDNGAAPGGKMNRWSARGYTFDTGPTLLTMPHVLARLFADLGERLEEHLELVPLDPHAQYVFPDGCRITVPAGLEEWIETARRVEPRDAEGIRSLHRIGERIYRLSEHTFFRSHPLSLRPPPAAALRCFPLRHAWGGYAKTVERFLRDPHLRQIYNRYPTYVGSSPYRCPATLLVIPYIEHAFGAWRVRGGMYRIVEALVGLARARGVEILSGAQAEFIEHERGRVRAVGLAGGGRLAADVVVWNGDAAGLAALLGRPVAPEPGSRSLSGFVLLAGLRARPAGLQAHTVIFSADYRGEFADLFERRRFPRDPTVYIHAPADAALAPPGGEALFIMANAPGEPSVRWDEAAVREARRRIVRRAQEAGLPDLDAEAEVSELWHPGRFEARYLAPGGAIYGGNSHGWRRAFLRPPNRARGYRGLYCAGGSFHPGGGVPMVLLSAEITARMVAEDWGS
jgi:phytoene desaturase